MRVGVRQLEVRWLVMIVGNLQNHAAEWIQAGMAIILNSMKILI